MSDLFYGALAGDMNALNVLFILGLPIVLLCELVAFLKRRARR